MTKLDNRIIKVLEDIDNLKGLNILTDDEELISLDLTLKDHPTICEDADGGDSRMFLYLFACGIKEGWLEINVDETHPKNKLNYINKLLNSYGDIKDDA